MSIGTDMFLIALFHEATHYEGNARIEQFPADLYRQVDTQDIVFSQREASSTRGVAPTSLKRLAAHAYQISSQSRIRRAHRQARDEFEDHCCRVFLDPTGKDNHRPTRRNVPLGKTIPQGCDCWRAPSGGTLGRRRPKTRHMTATHEEWLAARLELVEMRPDSFPRHHTSLGSRGR